MIPSLFGWCLGKFMFNKLNNSYFILNYRIKFRLTDVQFIVRSIIIIPWMQSSWKIFHNYPWMARGLAYRMGAWSHQQPHNLSWWLHNIYGLFKLFGESKLFPAHTAISKHFRQIVKVHGTTRQGGIQFRQWIYVWILVRRLACD